MADDRIEVGSRTVARVGLGTNRLTDTESNRSFLMAAVEAGLDFIDTAYLYTDGASESTIGATFGPPPKGVVVATKGGYHPGGGVEGLERELRISRERLASESIDLYYLHRDHPDAAIEAKMELLAGERDEGRIVNVGLSEVGVDQIERARSIVPIAAVQNEYSLAERKHDDVVDHCRAEGIAFVPFFPLRGSRSGVVETIAGRHAATPNQIAIAWLLQRSPTVAPIPGTLSIEHLRENLAAAEVELTEQDVAALDRISA